MLQKVLWWGSVVAVVAAALGWGSSETVVGAVAATATTAEVVGETVVDAGFLPLVLVLLGLVSGFLYPIEDVTTRVGYYVLAAFLPGIADIGGAFGVQKDGVLATGIPGVGPFLVDFLANFAFVIAGVAIASFLLSLYKGLMAAGND